MTIGRIFAFGLTVLLAQEANQAAKADSEGGHKVFVKYCLICHSLDAGKNKVGPSLSGIVGRKSGSVENFDYSESLRSLSLTWTPQTLDQYLTAPSKMAPGTRMTFAGLPNQDDRQSLIEFLATVHD